MTQTYLGQIGIFAFNFAPKGWAQCNGQLLSISANQALFALLGIQYGGNGSTNFALPNLQSRIPIGYGTDPGSGINYVQGQIGGEESHTLLLAEMPQHNHRLMADATTAATSNGGTPTGSTVLGNSTGTVSGGGAPFQVQIYSNAAANNILAPQAVGNTGTGTSHENRMPYLVVNFCMALQGIFPSRN